MRNPFYKAQAAQSEEPYEHAAALAAVERYLHLSEATEEISEAKLRRVHPDLADNDVWKDVVSRLRIEESADAPAPPRRSRGRR